MAHDDLERELLEYGLEDDIPLGEAVGSPDVQRAAGGSGDTPEVREAIARTLRSLLDRNLIVVSRGRLQEGEPDYVPPAEAAELLTNLDWFDWGREENEERIYFVNVENILGPYRPEWIQ